MGWGGGGGGRKEVGNKKFNVFSDQKQNEVQSARAEPAHKGGNQRSKYVTQTQKQRPESPTVTLTWHACNTRRINSTIITPMPGESYSH